MNHPSQPATTPSSADSSAQALAAQRARTPARTPALRLVLAIAQVISVIGVSTINLTQPKFAPLVGDALGPWASPLVQQAAEAVDAAIGQPKVAAAAVTSISKTGPVTTTAGSTITYTLRITNNAVAAGGVVVADILTPAVGFGSVFSNGVLLAGGAGFPKTISLSPNQSVTLTVGTVPTITMMGRMTNTVFAGGFNSTVTTSVYATCDVIYAVQSNFAFVTPTQDLYIFDPPSGPTIRMNPSQVPTYSIALAVSPDGRYLVSVDRNFPFQIDVFDVQLGRWTTTTVALPERLSRLAYDASGTLWGSAQIGSTQYQITPTLPTPTIGPGQTLTDALGNAVSISTLQSGDIAFAADGTGYIVDQNGSFFRFSPTTRVATYIGAVKTTAGRVITSATSLAFGSDGQLYIGENESGSGPNYIATIDPSTAVVSYIPGTTTTVNDFASCVFPVLAPSVGISKTNNPVGSVTAGTRITYTMVISNDGNLPDSNVTFSDTIPANTTFVAGSLLVRGGNGAVVSSTVSQVGSLIRGQIASTGQLTGVVVAGSFPTNTVVITYAVTVNAGTPNGTNIVNTAQITTAQVPTQTSSVVNNIVGAVLSISKVANVVTTTAGSQIVYTVLVTNTSSLTSTGAVVSDTIPASTTLVGVVNYTNFSGPSSGTCTIAGQTFSCPLGTLPPGGTARITATIATTITLLGPITNTAVATSTNTTPVTGTVTVPLYGACDVIYAVSDITMLAFDPLSGPVVSMINSLQTLSVTSSLALSPDGRYLWYTTRLAPFFLHYLDTQTGVWTATSVSAPFGARLAFDPQGRLWLGDQTGGLIQITATVPTPTVGPTLQLIDASGNASLVGSVGGGDIVFDANGTGYLVNGIGWFFRFDTTTRVATYIGQVRTSAGVAPPTPASLAFGPDGQLYLGSTNAAFPIYVVDPATALLSVAPNLSNPSNDFTSCTFPTLAPSVGISKTNNPVGSVTPGTRITYTMVISNDGNLPDGAVAFSDTIPANTTFVAGSLVVLGGNGAVVSSTVSQAGSLISGYIASTGQLAGVLLAGSFPTNTVVITYAVTVNASVITGTNIVNTAQVSTSLVPTPSVSTVTNTVVAATLIASKSAAPSVVRPGDIVTYTIRVTNTSAITATGVQVSDTVPSPLVLQTSTATQGSYAAPIWTVGTITPSTSVILTLTALIPTSVASGTAILNTAVVTSPTSPPVTPTVTITPAVPSLAIDKQANVVTATAGSQIVYTIRVTNTSNVTVTNANVSDTIPVSTSFVGAVNYTNFSGPSSGTCTITGQQFNCALGTVLPGGTARITATIATTITWLGLITNTAVATSTNTTPVTDTVTVPLYGACDVVYGVGAGALPQSVFVPSSGPVTMMTNPVSPLSATAALAISADGRYLWTADSTTGNLQYFDAQIGVWQRTAVTVAFGLIRLGFDPAGRLWGSTNGNQLFQITTTLPTPTVGPGLPIINAPGNAAAVGIGGDLAFAADGTGYLIDSLGSFFRINPTTQVATYIGSAKTITGLVVPYNAIAFGADGRLYTGSVVSTTNTIYSTDPSTGIVTAVPNTLLSESDFASCAYPVLAPSVGISKTNNPVGNVTAGTRITYTMVISNNGNLPDSNVTFSDTIPANTTFVAGSLVVLGGNGAVVSSTVSQVGSNISGQIASTGQLTGVLLAGSFPTNTVVITYAVTVNAGVITGTTLVNTAQITTAQVPTPSVSTVTNTVQAPVLIATKTASPALVRSGDTVTYTIRVTNTSNVTATNVSVSDSLPSPLVLQTSTASTGSYVSPTWTVGQLNPGANAILTLTALIPTSVASGTAILNTAVVTSPTSPPVTPTVTITPVVPVLTATKVVASALGSVTRPGDVVTYTIRVTNTSNVTATGVVVTDMVPSPLVLQTSSASQGSYVSPTWTLGQLNPGANAILTLTALIPLSTVSGTIITNTAVVTSPITAPVTPTVTITPVAPSLTSIKSASPSVLDPSDTVTYTVRVTNTGDVTATGVVVIDGVPAPLVLQTSSTSQGSYVAPNWTVGTINPGANATLTLTALLPANAVAGTIITNTAVVTSPTTTPITPTAPIYVSGTCAAAQQPVVNGTFAGSLSGWSATGAWVYDVGGYAYDPGNFASNHILSQNVTGIAPSSRLNVTLRWNNGSNPTLGNNGNSAQLDVRYAGVTYLRITTPQHPTALPANAAVLNGATSNIVGALNSPFTDINFQLTLPAGIPAAGAIEFVMNVTGSGDPLNDADDFGVDNVSFSPTNLCLRKQTINNTGAFNFTTSNLDTNTSVAGTQNTAAITTTTTNSFAGYDAATTAGAQAIYILNEAVNVVITETAVAGWSVSGTCYNANTNAVVGNINSAGVVNIPAASIVAGNSYICDYTNTQTPILTATKSAAPSVVVAGNLVTYTIRVTNTGALTATSVTVSDTVPSPLVLQTSSASQGSYAAPTWTVGQVNPGATAILTLTALVPIGIVSGTAIVNTAVVTSPLTSPITPTVTITPVVPVLIASKTAAPSVVRSGDVVTYTIRVTNTSNVTATSVNVSDSLPSPLVLQTSSASQGSYVAPTWTVGQINPGATVILTLTALIPTSVASGTAILNTAVVTSPNIVPVTPTVTITPVVPTLIATKSASPSVLRPGDTVTYTIRVTNTSAVTATGVQVSDTLPSPLVLQTSTASQGSYVAPTWTLGQLNPGQGKILTLTALIPTSVASGTAIVNTAVVTSPTSPPVTPTVTITPVVPTLIASKTAVPSVVRPGDTVTYTIQVTNTSAVTATNVSVSDSLPSPLVFQTSTATQGSYAAPTWTVGTINPGVTVILTLTALIPTSVASGTAILNTAVVTSPTSLPVTPTVTITPVVPVLIASKTAAPSVVLPGDLITYTIRVTNTSNVTATNVSVSDSLPSPLVLQTSTASQGSYAAPTWTVGQINPGATVILTLTALVPIGIVSGTAIVNTAVVTSPTTTPVTPTVTITPQVPSLAIDKQANVVTTTAGSQIVYTIRVTNTSNVTVTNANVSDTIPTSTTLVGAVNYTNFSGPTSGTCTITGQTFNCALGTVLPGGTARITATIATTITLLGPITNTAVATSTVTVPVTDTVSVPLYGACDVVYAVSGLSMLAFDPLSGPVISMTNSIQTLSTTSTLAVSPDGRYLWYTTGSTPSFLHYFDTQTGVWTATSVSTTFGARLAFDPQGRLWLGTQFGGLIQITATVPTPTVGPTLQLIDASGNAQPVGLVGSGDIVFDADGTGYLVNGIGWFFRFDTTTRVATYIGQVRTSAGVAPPTPASLAFGPDGQLYLGSTNAAFPIYVVDPATALLSVAPNLSSPSNDFSSCTFPTLAPSVGISKTNNPVASVTPGTRITYTMVISNDGNLPDGAVAFSDTIPANTTFVAGSLVVLGGNGAVVSNTVSQAGSLISGYIASPGQLTGVLVAGSFPTNTVVITYAVTVNAGVITGTNIVNTAQVTTSLVPTPSVSTVTNTVQVPVLIASKTASPAVVRPGDTVTYTIRVTNTSAVTATNVSVSDSLPSPLVLQTSTASQGSYAAPTWTVGQINPGATVILTLTALIPTSVASGTAILNTAVVTSPTSPPVTPTVTITPVVPTLIASKTAAPSVLRPGDTVTYTIRVTNTSSVTATNVSVSDSLPSPLVFQTSTATQGSYAAPTWTVGQINPGANVILTLTALIPTSVASGTAILNTAVVTSPTSPPVTPTVTITPVVPTLIASKTAEPSVVRPGDLVTYTIQVTNTSNVTATNVSVSDSLPSPLVFQTSTASQGSYAAPTWTVGTINPGANVILTLTALIPTSVASGTAILNTAVVTNPTSPPVTPTVTITPVVPVLVISKLATPSVVYPGGQVTYTIRVTNTSSVTASNVTVSDTLPGAVTYVSNVTTQGTVSLSLPTITWNVGTLLAGQSESVSVVVNVGSNVISGTAILNTAAVTSPINPPTTTPPVTVTVIATPALQVSKSVTPSVSLPGGQVVYTIRVTSTGNTTATNVADAVILDDLPSGVTLNSASCTVTTGTCVVNSAPTDPVTAVVNLPGNSVGVAIVTITGTVSSNLISGTQLVNTAVVTVPGVPVTRTPPVTVTVVSAILIASKTATPDVVRPGDVVTYTIRVTNTSNVTATNVSVSDSLPSPLVLQTSTAMQGSYAAPTWTVGQINPGATVILTLSALIPTSVASGTAIVNTAVVTSPTSPPVTPTVTITPVVPVLIASKTATPAVVRPGDVVTYTIRVTNTSNVTATNVSVSDSLPTPLVLQISTASQGSYSAPTWTVGTINPGATVILTLTALIPTSVASGTAILNTAVVTSPTSPPVTPTVTITPVVPTLIASKSAAPSVVRPGDVVTYTIRVTNTSSVTATNVNVSDSLPSLLVFQTSSTSQGSYAAPIWTVGTINPGTTVILTLTALIPTSVASGTAILNTAVVTSPNITPVTPTVTITPVVPTLIASKTAAPGLVRPGDVVTYTIQVTNTSSVTATNVSVSDSLPSPLVLQTSTASQGSYAAPTWTVGTINPGATVILTLTALIPTSVASGTAILNTAVVTSPTSPPVTPTVTITPVVPTLIASKSAAPAVVRPGDPVTYTIRVTNTSSVTATNVSVSDSLPSPLVLQTSTATQGSYAAPTWTVGQINPGATVILTLTALIPTSVASGTAILNTAVVTSPTSPPVTPTVTITPVVPVLIASKSAGPAVVRSGDTVTYTIQVTNTSNVTATNVSVSDSLPSPLVLQTSTASQGSYAAPTWTVGQINPGATVILTLTALIPTSVASGTAILNTAVVTSPTSPPVTPTVTITPVVPVLIASKTAAPSVVRPGDLVTYTIRVTNTSSVTATNVSVSDSLPSPLVLQTSTASQGSYAAPTWTVGTINPGATVILTLTALIPTGVASGTAILNTAVVTSPTSPPVTPTVTITPVVPILIASKTAAPNPVRPGDVVTYTIQVTNTSNVTATNVSVSDSLPSPLVFQTSTASQGSYIAPVWTVGQINPGASVILTLTALIPTSVASGTAILNTAVVTSPNITPVTPTVIITPVVPTLIASKTAAPSVLRPGDVVTYTIQVTNTSNVTATNVSVSDSLPSPLVFQTSTASQGSYAAPTWTVGQINPGATVILTLTVLIPTSVASGTAILNTAVVTSPTSPPVTPTVTITPVSPVLTISKLATPATASPGGQVTYTIRVTNTSSVTASTVTVSDTLPGGVTYVSNVPTQGTVSLSLPTITWNVGTLLAGQSESVLVVVTINSNLISGTQVLNTAVVTSPINPPTTTPPVTVTVIATPALQVSKSVTPSVSLPGGQVVYTIRVTSTGNTTATNVADAVIFDDVPAGVTLNSASCVVNVGTCVVNPAPTDPVTAVVNLPGNSVGVAIVTITGTVSSSLISGTQLINTAVVTVPGVPVTRTPPVTVTIIATPTVRIGKIANVQTTIPGGQVVYTIRITNTGNTTVTNALLGDAVPSQVTPNTATCSLVIGGSSCTTPTIAGQFVSTTVNLNLGSMAELVITGTIDENVVSGTAILNTAVVTVPGGVPTTTPPVTVTVIATPALQVSKSVTPSLSFPGGQVVYTIRVTSTGNTTATNVADAVIFDDVPVGVTLNAASCSVTVGTCVVNPTPTDPVTAVVNLPGNSVGVAIVTITGTVSSSLISGTQLINTAVVTVPGVPVTRTPPVTVTVISAILIASKTATPSVVRPGDTVTYTIQVTNTSSVTATGVTVSDSLPSPLVFQTSSASQGSYAAPVWSVGQINPGATVILTLTALIPTSVASGTAILNTAVVTAPTSPPVTPTVTITPVVPTLIASKLATPAVVRSGDLVTYTIRVTNTSAVTASNVTVSDTVPNPLVLQSSGVSQGSYTAPVWTVGTINPGTTAILTLTALIPTSVASGTAILNTAVVTSPITPPITPTVTITSVVPVLIASKLATPAVVRPGDTVTYTIQVTNTSSVTATNVSVSDSLPTPLVLQTSTASTGSYVSPVWTVGQINPGATVILTLTVLIPTSVASGTAILNTAVVTSPTSPPVTPTVTITPVVPVLIANKTAAPAMVRPGDLVTYTIQVTNTSSVTATNVSVSDSLPSPLVLQTSTTSQGSYVAPVWTVGQIDPGETVILTLTALIPTSVASGTAILNTAVVTSPTSPPVTPTVTITPVVPVLAISKLATPATASPGGQVTYTIRVTNTGIVTASNVTVSDALPGGVTYVSNTPTQGTVSLSLPVVTWNVGTLLAGQSENVLVVVTLDSNLISGTQVLNTAVVTSPINPPTTTPPVTVTVIATPAVQVSKSASPNVVYPGDQIVYTIRVTSTGNTTATNVADAVILDDLPGGVTLNAASCSVTVGTCVVNPTPTDPVTAVVNLPGNSLGIAIVTITGTASANLISGTKLLNTAVVTVPGEPVTRTPQVTVTVIATPTVAIGKIASAQTSRPGETVVYTIRVTNTGNTTVTNVAVGDLVPSGMTPNSASCVFVTGGSSCTLPVIIGQFVSTTANLNLSSVAALVITGTIDGNVISGTQLLNTAVVTVPGVPPTTTPPVTVTVIATPTVQVSKLANVQSTTPGGQVVYTVRVTNTGNTTVTNAAVGDLVPNEVTPNTATCNIVVGGSLCSVPTIVGQLVQAGVSLDLNSVAQLIITGTLDGNVVSGTLIANTVVVTVPGGVPTTTPPVTVTVIATPALQVSKTASPSVVYPGAQIVYTIKVTSTGNTTATNVADAVILDDLPAGVTLNSASCVVTVGTCVVNPVPTDPVTAEVNLPGNSVGVATVTITATASSGLISGTQLLNTAVVTVPGVPVTRTPPVTVTIIATPTVAIGKIANVRTSTPGGTVVYTIRITNTGNTTVTNAAVGDLVPSGVTPNSASCAIVTGGSSCTLPVITGQSVSTTVQLNLSSIAALVITGTVNANVISGTLIGNTAVVTVPGEVPTTTPPVTVTVIATPTVQVSKIANVRTSTPGGTIVYTIRITNTGNTTVTNAAVSDLVPSGVTPNSASCAMLIGGSVCTVPTIVGQLVQAGVSLNLGSVAQLVITSTVNANIISGTLIANTAVVTVPGEVPTTTPPVTVTVIATPTVQVSKIANVRTSTPGGTVVYTIRITNTGNTTVTNAAVGDLVPSGVTPNNASCGIVVGGSLCSVPVIAGQLVQAGVSLNLGSVAQLVITGTVNTSVISGTQFANTAVVTVPGEPPTTTPPVTVTVIATPTVMLVKSVDRATAFPGDQVVYTIRITNTGNTTVTNVPIAVSDLVPLQVTGLSASCAIVLGGSSCAAPTIVGQSVRTQVTLTLNAAAALVITGTLGSNVISGTQIGNTAVVTVPGEPPTTTPPVTTTVIATPTVAVSKIANVQSTTPGGQVVYTIRITNTGNTTVTNAAVGDLVPSGVTPNSASCSIVVGGSVCSVPVIAGQLVQAGVSLNLGSVAQLVITSTVNAEVISGTQIANTAVVTVPRGVPTQTVPVTVTVVATPSITVGKTVNRALLQPGDQVVYRVPITNTGITPLTGVTLTDQVPTQVSVTATSCVVVLVGSAGTTSCTVPTVTNNLVETRINLGVGASTLLVITGTVRGDVVSGTQIINTAIVPPDPLLGLPGASSPPVTSTVVLPVLQLVKTANIGNRPQVVVGDLVTYTIAVSNVGAGIAYNVVITDPVPTSTEYVPGSANPAAEFSNNTLRWTVPSLLPGQVVLFTLQLRVTFVGERGAIINVAYTSADGSSTVVPGAPPVTASDDAGVPITPTAVVLLAFQSEWLTGVDGNGVRVSWQTGSELNTFGFVLYRSTTGRREDAVRVTPELIASRSANNAGASYTFDDVGAVPGQTYTYWLQEVETSGNTLEYGPVDTDGLAIHQPNIRHLFLPVMLR